MAKTMRFKDKCAVITGAGDGIGLAYAHALATEGAAIVVADVNAKAGEKAAADIIAAGGRALATTTDVSKDEEVLAMAAAACEAFGGVDILVNNAGKHLRTYGVPPTKIDMRLWREAFDVNVTAPLVCVRACLPSMRERGGGIINQSSNGAFVGKSTYHITKLALITLTTALAAELAADNIRVNAIAPGMVDSPAQMAANSPEFQQTIINQQCIKRLGRVDELLGALLYLCSDDSSFMTGQTLIVDGGRILRT
jgi:NAD(P)-dependent dehydrogenase (short-subunit alcohol dehydrogenase family)